MNGPTYKSSTLFFDLDGTLSDPSDGITRCIQYALERLGRPYPPKAELVQFIGPPLRWTFPRLLGTDDDALVDRALAYYRERYARVGLFENEVYPDIPDLLARLHAEDYRLYVVTSKPKVYSERIIEHFGFDRYFAAVFGPELDGRFDDKEELIAFILSERRIDASVALMIGDRARDIEAAKANGVRTIGVTYGFGSRQEISAAEPDRICHKPQDIYRAVMEIVG